MKKTLLVITAGILAVSISACQLQEKETSTAVIGDMSNTGSQSINDALAGLSDDTNTSVALNVMPDSFNRTSAIERAGHFIANADILVENLYAASGSISREYDPSNPWTSAAATSFYELKTFTGWNNGSSKFSVDGNVILSWQGLDGTKTGKDKVKSGTTIDQAPVDKKFTNLINGRYMTVVGHLQPGLSHDFAIGGAQAADIAHSVTVNSASATGRDYNLSIDLTRTGYNAAGTKLFQHNVSTPNGAVNVVADLAAHTRTINGTVRVEHVIADVTMTSTYSNFVYSTLTNEPVSGTITIVITGNLGGNGTIVFASGSGEYDITINDKHVAGTIEY